MQTLEQIKAHLADVLSEKRFIHTIGVAETAEKLAVRWGVDPERAYLAGLVHDCAKEMHIQKALEILKDSEYELDGTEESFPALLHAPVGACLAKSQFGIEDEEILNAVRYHTTGRVGMTLLEKIIYVADFIEPNRQYPEAEMVAEIAMQDIDAAVLFEADAVIKFTIDRGKAIHPVTVIARNSFLKKEGK